MNQQSQLAPSHETFPDGMANGICIKPFANIAALHSLYADDVVIFLQPSASDIRITLDILQLFGEASGLRTNVQKSSVHPHPMLGGTKNDIAESSSLPDLRIPLQISWSTIIPPQTN